MHADPGRGTYAQQVCGGGVRAEFSDALTQVMSGRYIKDHFPVAYHGEAYMRAGQGVQTQLLFSVTSLSFCAFQKLSAYGRVVKKFAHLDASSRRTTCGADFLFLASVTNDLRTLYILPATRGDIHVRHGCDAGQSFSTEAELTYVVEVLVGGELAGGVALQTESQVLPTHSFSVITHLDAGDAAARDFDSNDVRTGVNAVLNKFFDDRCRPFHHLPGSHLAGEHIIHPVDCLALFVFHLTSGSNGMVSIAIHGAAR